MNQVSVHKERISNIELLRLVLMLFIVIHHGIVFGLGLDALSPWGTDLRIEKNDMPYLCMFNCFLIFAVNTFILISGYFSIHLSIEKVIRIILPFVLFTLLFTTIPYFIIGNKQGAINSLLFLSHTKYWFIPYYLFLMFLAPVLNRFYEGNEKKNLTLLIGMLIIINCYFGFLWGDKVNINGYTLMQFIMMYCIGKYIRVNAFSPSMLINLLIFFVSSVLCGVLCYYYYSVGQEALSWKMTFYNNPLVLIASVSFFLFFLKIKLKSKIINWASKSALSVYLFQNSAVCSKYYYQFIQFEYQKVGLLGGCIIIIILSLLICILAICIDKFLSLGYMPVLKKIRCYETG